MIARDWHAREGLALLTDFYELTMMAGYLHDDRRDQRVCFNYFFRNLPPDAGFAVCAGLGDVLAYLEHLRFDADDLDYLRSLGLFQPAFIDHLASFRPHLTVRAVPEGTLVFPHEPVIQIEGPLFDAQLVETALLNFMNYQTLIATKAARVCLAAAGDPVLEFGLRRAHGPDGGLSASRAAHIGGCTHSSNVLAGKVHGVPVAGTHAHSWVMSFDSELEAFRAFARRYPDRCVLLVDTYDTVRSGVPNAIQVFREMRERGELRRPAIRLDSGDLAKLSKIAWRMLRDAGFEDPLIVASNDLNEDLIADLKRQGAKINAWGVGTHLVTAHDAPSLPGVYKLVALERDGRWHARIKVSSNVDKATDPGAKQLIRYANAEGQPLGDLMALAGEAVPERGPVQGRNRRLPHRHARIEEAAQATPLLETVMQEGRRLAPPRALADIRAHAQAQIAALPDEFKRLRNPEIYQVLLSNELGELKEQLMQGHA